MKLNNKVYDILKWTAQIGLPALGTLYFALSQIWGLPYGEEIVGTITAIDICIGALIGISSISYNKAKGIENYLNALDTEKEDEANG